MPAGSWFRCPRGFGLRCPQGFDERTRRNLANMPAGRWDEDADKKLRCPSESETLAGSSDDCGQLRWPQHLTSIKDFVNLVRFHTSLGRREPLSSQNFNIVTVSSHIHIPFRSLLPRDDHQSTPCTSQYSSRTQHASVPCIVSSDARCSTAFAASSFSASTMPLVSSR